MGFVGALEIALELQIVWRICEHQIDRTSRELRHLGDAIADDNTCALFGLKFSAGRPCRRPATRHNHDSITLTQATLSATRGSASVPSSCSALSATPSASIRES